VRQSRSISSNLQYFARKIVRAIGFQESLTRGFENEVRAYRKLSEEAAPDIVRFLREGKLNADTYFINMELSIGTLADYIHNWTPNFSEQSRRFSTQSKTFQIWEIAESISSGLVYIHSRYEIHRDVKPMNGMDVYHRVYSLKSCFHLNHSAERLEISTLQQLVAAKFRSPPPIVLEHQDIQHPNC
jgi:serine/threonine protein kinase